MQLTVIQHVTAHTYLLWIAGSVKKMDLEVRVGPNFAILSWQKFKLADSRQLLSYVINYREA